MYEYGLSRYFTAMLAHVRWLSRMLHQQVIILIKILVTKSGIVKEGDSNFAPFGKI